jgi:DNA polymerase family B
MTHEGQLVIRGIEIRRHDTPNFIKEFQTELLYTLFDCKDAKEIMNRGYENALLLVTKATDKIMLGGEAVKQEDLIISKVLGQDITKYRSLFPHVSAAIQLSNEDNRPFKGDTIRYIYTDSAHKNLLCRVVPIYNIQKIVENQSMTRKNTWKWYLTRQKQFLGTLVLIELCTEIRRVIKTKMAVVRRTEAGESKSRQNRERLKKNKTTKLNVTLKTINLFFSLLMICLRNYLKYLDFSKID